MNAEWTCSTPAGTMLPAAGQFYLAGIAFRNFKASRASKGFGGGKATREDADALREEGIEFSSLPPFLSSDQH
jgi:hypothetical protein